MSNVSYSKLNLIIGTSRAVLVNDNTNTGNEVREITYYVNPKNIVRSNQLIKNKLPEIAIEDEQGAEDIRIPSSDYMMTIGAYYSMDESLALDKLSNLVQRIKLLIKPDVMNAIWTGRKLRCRQVNILNDVSDDNAELKYYGRKILFHLICDDEII